MKRTKKKAAMLDNLRKSLGNVTIACKACDINRKTHYEWLKVDPDYAAEVEAIMDEQGDFVENKLLQKIKEGDTTAIIFYSKTKLKNRGYSEKHELDISGDLVIDVNES